MKRFEQSSGILLIVLLGFILFGLALRFAWPGDALFIADEPLFLSLLDWHRMQHSFPLTSFRGSSIPFPYGAGALWIYAVMQWFTDNVVTMVVWHTLIYALGLLSLFPILRRSVSRENIFWVLALSLTSPYLFFFSRHNWDNTFFVALTGAALLLRVRMETTRWPKLCLFFFSLLLGYLPNIHLMSAPAVIALGLSLFPWIWRREKTWGQRAVLLALAILPGVLFLVPYTLESLRLFEAEKNLYPRKPREWWGDVRNLWWLMHKQMIFFSLWKMKDQFKQVYPQFLAFSGTPWTFFFRTEIFAWIPKLFAVAYIFSIPVRAWRKRNIHLLEGILALAFFGFILLLNTLNIPTEPHYFHAVWWVPFVALGFALEYWNQKWIGLVVKVFLFATILVNCAFIWNYTSFVHENHGMRNYFHSTGVADLREATRELCVQVRDANGKAPALPVKIFLKEVWVFSHPLNYFRAHLVECDQVMMEFVTEREQAHWLLEYNLASETDARLFWKRNISL